MQVLVAFLAVVAVAVANPLPLVQLIVNVDAPAGYNPVAIEGPINPTPVIEKPEPIIPGPVNIVDSADVEPIIVPEPAVLPAPVLPVVIVPEPAVLPSPVLPGVVVPEPVVLPAPVLPEVVPEEVIVAVPVVSPSVMDH